MYVCMYVCNVIMYVNFVSHALCGRVHHSIFFFFFFFFTKLSMAPVLSSLCILPSSNVAPIHSLRTIPHPLFLHHSRMRNLSILAASEASDSLHSSSAHHHHHQHQKPLKSSSPFSSIIPPLAASILVFSVCSPPPGTYLLRDALKTSSQGFAFILY